MSEVDPLLAEAECRTKEVTLPSGQKVIVREITMAEFSEYGESMGSKPGEKAGAVQAKREDALVALLVGAVITAEGKPRFTADAARKIARSARVASPIVSAIMEVSGFGPAEKKG